MSLSSLPDAILKPIIGGYTTAIQPSIAFIVMGSIFSPMTLPMIVTLFYFSSSALRKKPIFILNILSLMGCWVIGVGNAYMELTAVLSPLTGVSHTVYAAWVSVYIFLPWFAELALLFRLFAVYPPRRVGTLAVCIILAFPICLKITRLTVISLFLARWVQGTRATTDLIGAAQTIWLTTPYVRIEWISQLIDNAYVSGLFLWKLHRDGRVFSREDTGVVNPSQESFTSRIRVLFWIGTTNFVLPVAFNVVQVAIVFKDADIYTSTYVLMANVYIVTISTVFATVWSSLGSEAASRPRLPNSVYNGNCKAGTAIATRGASSGNNNSASSPSELAQTKYGGRKRAASEVDDGGIALNVMGKIHV